MEIQETIVNKVAQSGLLTIDLAHYAPKEEIYIYDIKENLFHGLILKEKDFREFVKTHNWEQYEGKHVGIICSTDAIVPTWAYMLLANKLEPFALSVNFGDEQVIYQFLFQDELNRIDMEAFKDQRVVIKGCGDIAIPESAFVKFTANLSKVAKSIMYGEPCSTVPIFKRKT
ncbi:DUF2480 family protein [Sphingobacterium hungaricum]|uniref:DUF2480 family protein n=1 Tax=Sphingobacterium hungaricum TaxID=2082723 RepID=A0A928YRM8_9SPHI|nr:DUF2480 family protein [Sphingobacterium hungaricum]MBE8713473.1 hypothetical protein [Sphingobacterium hungaricum]